MKILTLIPNVDTYGVMLLAILSLGSFSIAGHIHIRWLKSTFSFIGSNAAVKSALAIIGLMIIPLSELFQKNIFYELVGLFIGIIFGLLTTFIELSMIRKMNRNNIKPSNHQINVRHDNLLRNAKIIKKKLFVSTLLLQSKGLNNVRADYSQYAAELDFVHYSLSAVVIVAIAEEFLFRGYLISLYSLLSNHNMMIFAVLCSTLLFALSHINNSWNEFKCKLPLSIFTTIGFLATGTLLCAIATHVTLNLYAYFQHKKLNIPQASYNYLSLGMMK